MITVCTNVYFMYLTSHEYIKIYIQTCRGCVRCDWTEVRSELIKEANTVTLPTHSHTAHSPQPTAHGPQPTAHLSILILHSNSAQRLKMYCLEWQTVNPLLGIIKSLHVCGPAEHWNRSLCTEMDGRTANSQNEDEDGGTFQPYRSGRFERVWLFEMVQCVGLFFILDWKEYFFLKNKPCCV